MGSINRRRETKQEAIVVVQTKEDGGLGLDGSGNAGQKWLEVE